MENLDHTETAMLGMIKLVRTEDKKLTELLSRISIPETSTTPGSGLSTTHPSLATPK